MDSGLGVQWPLSPCATAVAAGTLVAFCLALWKHRTGAKRRTGKDPRGRSFGKNLDPTKQKNDSNKSGKEKSVAEAEKSTADFPVLAFRDVARRFTYENLRLSGQFGAIPRTLQRTQTLENPNLCSDFRRRKARKKNENWHEINITSPNQSSIYQQSLCFANELSRHARFLLSISPHLQTYIRQFSGTNEYEQSGTCDFDKFDVAINPEILKDRPITRSAVCLALDRQLHKFLEEPFREIKLCERAIQTTDISEDDDEGASGSSTHCEANLISDTDIITEQSQYRKDTKNCSSYSSLWDSGYGEKDFDDRCITPKDPTDLTDSLTERCFDDSSNSGAFHGSVNTEVSLESSDCRINESGLGEISEDQFQNTTESVYRNNHVVSEENVLDPVTELTVVHLNLDITECADLAEQKNVKQLEEGGDSKEENNSHVVHTLSNQGNENAQSVIKKELQVTLENEYSSLQEKNNLKFSDSADSCKINLFTEDSQIQENANIIKLQDLKKSPLLLEQDSNFQEVSATNLNFSGAGLSFKNPIDKMNGLDSSKSCKGIESDPCLMQVNSCEETENGCRDSRSDIYSDSNAETLKNTSVQESVDFERKQSVENLSHHDSNLEQIQNKVVSCSSLEKEQKSNDVNLSQALENMSVAEKTLNLSAQTCEIDEGSAEEVKSIECPTLNLENSELERGQSVFSSAEKQNTTALSEALETKPSEKRNSCPSETAAPSSDVTREESSRDSPVFDEKRTFNLPRQMDREKGERSVAVESTVTTETTLKANGNTLLSTAVVSRLTLDDWSRDSYDTEDSVSVETTVHEEVYRPTFEEFVPLKSSEKVLKSAVQSKDESVNDTKMCGSKNGSVKKEPNLPENEPPSSPRLDRLKGLLSRDEERRSRTKFHHLADSSHVGGAMEGEWDRLLRDVLASVSELERWERRHCDVSSDAEDAEQQHHFSQSDSSFTMEEEALSPKGETPTKVKNLRFKLDPDIFDVPSDDSFYDDDDDNRRGWKKQSKYRSFSSLELKNEPVKLVSVHASVVPGSQKMVARPVGIDLRVRLTEERQSKRAHVSTSPSQAKRRSPVSDQRIGWCQELSPVTENVDWREAFTPVAPECKSVPNGILKTPSPKTEPAPIESPNPFKLENGVTTNGVSPVIENKHIEKAKYNGWKPHVERKPFLIIRKKFEPDPEAIERITGYKSALSKPPLPPPPLSHKISILSLRNKAELARKQYLDNKAALANNRIDGVKKFQQFLSQAQNDRAKIVTSVPDLVAIERAVTEQWTKERKSVSPRESPEREDSKKSEGVTLSRGNTPDDKWASYVQSCRQHLGRRSQSMSYLETDVDIIPVLDEDDKYHSTSALDEPDEALPDPDDSDLDRSREDLDDSGRAKSEHELRIERSLRSLPVPDWYRRSDKTKAGFLLGSSNKEKRGWAAIKSLASSTSSLASCGLRRPVRSLRSSRENIPWSRSSASPDGPTLSLALAKAFREPYLGWRARTPTSSGVSSSPRASPPSWNATTDDEANGVSFDGEDAFGRTTSSEDDRRDEPLSLDDTGADAVTVSMDTNDPVKLPGGEDTCDDINNMSMDTCELFDASVAVPVDEDPSSPQADTGDDIDNLSTDTTTTEGRKLDPKLKRFSYSQSIYHSEWDEEEESRGDRKSKEGVHKQNPSSPDHKVVWIESSFVGSRTTTSIVVVPEKKNPGITQERPASR